MDRSAPLHAATKLTTCLLDASAVVNQIELHTIEQQRTKLFIVNGLTCRIVLGIHLVVMNVGNGSVCRVAG